MTSKPIDVQKNNWWAEWQYAPDEREHLTDARQREAKSCLIGPGGLYWKSDPPLVIKFGTLTRVEIMAVQPARLRFKWLKPMLQATPAYIPIVSELNFITAIFQLFQPDTVTLPIPRNHEQEAPALVERFQSLMHPSKIVPKAENPLTTHLISLLAIVGLFILCAMIVYMLLPRSGIVFVNR